MKSVVRIQQRGKVKDLGLRGLARVPAVEDVDSTVALIQELIPLRLQAVREALKPRSPPWRVSSTAAAWGSPRGRPLASATRLRLPPGPELPDHLPARSSPSRSMGRRPPPTSSSLPWR
jgi:hypothetical protein